MAGNLTAMIAAAFSGGAAPPVTTDPYFDYTTLLLPGNGTNGAQNNTFLDGSTNNFTITRNGNTTQGTFSPFSQTGWGNYFDGTGDYLTATNNSAYDFGSGNFTIEAFAYPTTASQLAFCARGETTGFSGFILSTTNFLATTNGSSWDISISFTTALTANAWNHVALVRNGNVYTAYLNGVANGTTTVSGTIVAGTAALTIGRRSGQTDYSGYLSNFRIVKGTAVYTAAFSPPTSPLTPISGTSLLTCQSNRFIDNSSNNFTITVNGNTSVVAFSPFNPSASWSAATYGGSGYFDGSGDYLTVPQSAGALDLGSGQFSLEFWWYPTSAATGQYPFIGESTGDWYVGVENNNIGLGRRGVTVDVNTTGFTLAANTWQHFVIARQSTGSNDTRIFVNGVLNGVGTTSQNYTIATTLRIGGQTGGSINGYLSSTNLVKGSVPAAYQTSSTTTGTQIFTPPTSPSTSVTGTQLLLNYTNAGIYDATSKNDLETVGNAQISTTQSKWGGSSIYLDGTGDYLDLSPSRFSSFGTGNFTVEFWMRTAGSTFNIINPATATGTGYWALLVNTGSGGFRWNDAYNSTNLWTETATSVLDNNWHHIAVVRNGTGSGNVNIYFDGVAQGTAKTDSTNYNGASTAWRIGSGNVGAFNGYIQDLRITPGIARYTANFTAPTAAFPTL